MNIRSFSVNLDIKDVMEWIAEVNRFVKYIEAPEEKRVNLVVCGLVSNASAW